MALKTDDLRPGELRYPRRLFSPDENEHRKKGLVVALNGICGAGKTTFCKRMDVLFNPENTTPTERKDALVRLVKRAEVLCAGTGERNSLVESVDMESWETIPQNWIATALIMGRIAIFSERPSPIILRHFYANQADWAWIFQSVQQRECILTMIHGHERAQVDDCLVLIDRDLEGNDTFASLQHSRGNITSEQYLEYEHLTSDAVKKFGSDVQVLFHTPVPECARRLLRRSKKTGESIPDEEYLAELEASHEAILGYSTQRPTKYSHAASPKFVIDSHNTDDPDDICARILMDILMPLAKNFL